MPEHTNIYKYNQFIHYFMHIHQHKLPMLIHEQSLLSLYEQQGKESNLRVKQLESDITFHIGRQESELALRVNSAAYHGDLYQLKSLIRAGADPNKTDYDGRSPLVWD